MTSHTVRTADHPMSRPVGLRLLGAPGDVAAVLVRLRAAGLAPTAPRQSPARTRGHVLAYLTVDPKETTR